MLPEHTGELLDTAGVDGVELITTVTVPAADPHPPTETVTLYVPLAAVVTDAIEGF